MFPEKQQTVVVNADVPSALRAARQALAQCGWKVARMDSFCILAETGMSFTSWGETITVQVKESGNITYLNVKSKLGWGVIDLGKNRKNIDKFLATLRRLISVG